MPATLEDPMAPPVQRAAGGPFKSQQSSALPIDITPRAVTLRDRVTTATLIPFSSADQVPLSLLSYLCEQMNREIEKGDTYPMTDLFQLEQFGSYWFSHFGAIMILGDIPNSQVLQLMERDGHDWDKECLGSFFIKPNYPGRSSHICNGSFIVTDAARNRGVGRLMGEGYLEWAPKLSYTYSIFNLVYETNVASCRIWDALGFKRIGKIKDSGNLRSYPDGLVDAIIYGRDLGSDGDDYATEERFDKIRFYLKHGKYPNGADRAEKSRLRSAATHYKLIAAEGLEHEKLMLKGKEVISDPQRQYEIARAVHSQQHGGINKSTATIAEKYHWVRIKETVSMVIKNCPECKDMSKQPQQPALRADATTTTRRATSSQPVAHNGAMPIATGMSNVSLQSMSRPPTPPPSTQMPVQEPRLAMRQHPQLANELSPDAKVADALQLENMQSFTGYDIPVDPTIMDGMSPAFSDFAQPTTSSLSQFASPTVSNPSHHSQSSQSFSNLPQPAQLPIQSSQAPSMAAIRAHTSSISDASPSTSPPGTTEFLAATQQYGKLPAPSPMDTTPLGAPGPLLPVPASNSNMADPPPPMSAPPTDMPLHHSMLAGQVPTTTSMAAPPGMRMSTTDSTGAAVAAAAAAAAGMGTGTSPHSLLSTSSSLPGSIDLVAMSGANHNTGSLPPPPMQQGPPLMVPGNPNSELPSQFIDSGFGTVSPLPPNGPFSAPAGGPMMENAYGTVGDDGFVGQGGFGGGS